MSEELKKAVALKYTHGTDFAPYVLAQGNGRLADEMIEIARRENIYIHEDKDMIEILSSLDQTAHIPPELYRAVAETLAFVYAVSGKF